MEFLYYNAAYYSRNMVNKVLIMRQSKRNVVSSSEVQIKEKYRIFCNKKKLHLVSVCKNHFFI